MIGLIILGASAATVIDAGTVQFPEEYRSAWADSAKACRPEQADFLSIADNTITYVEGLELLVGIVSDNAAPDGAGRTIVADVVYEYAGETSAPFQLRLTVDGDVLLTSVVGKERVDRLVRCPAGTVDMRTDRH